MAESMVERVAESVAASLIVRVITGGPRGQRIVLYELRSRAVHEFTSWEEALEYLQHLSRRSGLR